MEISGKRAELCDICQSEQASGFCNDCNEYMCQRCFQNHTTAKPCRDHVLAPLDKASDLQSRKTYEEKCKVHKTENVRYCCRKHNTVGCGDCLLSQHPGCKAEIIKDLALEFEASVEFKEFQRRLEKCDADIRENTKIVECNIRQNKELFDKVLDEILKFRKEINAYIDRVENDVTAEASKRFKDNETMFAQLQQKIAEVSKEIDDIREQVDAHIHRGENLFMRVVECKSREAVVQQTVAEINSRNMFKTYMFQPEQKLKDVLTFSIRLGKIQSMENDEKQEATFSPFRRAANEEDQQSESSLTPKQHFKAKKLYFPPDPRSAGYDVGKRVKRFRRDECAPRRSYYGTRPLEIEIGKIETGTIVSVDPSGWVEVRWDNGNKCRVKPEDRGKLWVKLL